MASAKENDKAVRDIFPRDILDEFIDWIVENMSVDDVYPESALNQWAKDNDWIKIEDS